MFVVCYGWFLSNSCFLVVSLLVNPSLIIHSTHCMSVQVDSVPVSRGATCCPVWPQQGSEAQGPCVNRPLESTGVVARLLTQGGCTVRRPRPQHLLAQSGVHPVQRACQYPSTQPKFKLPDLEKQTLFFVGWKKKKKRDKTNAFQMQSGVALNDEPR